MDKIKKTLIIILVLIAVGALGFVAGQNLSKDEPNNPSTSSGQTVYSNSSDLRKDLNIALAEHVGLTLEAMRVSYDDHESTTAAVDELDKNSQEIAEILGNFYGEEAKNTFLKMWQDHITYFVNYTISVKNDDKEGAEQALSDLEDYSQEAAEFFFGVNSNLAVDSTKPLFIEHRDLIIASINDYTDEKYPESFDNESKAYSQAGKLADTLSDGIIKQYPEQFN